MKERNPFVQALEEFHEACGYRHSPRPSVEDDEKRALWSQLFREEADELMAAIERRDLVGVADGLGDVIYVTLGAALAFGIPIEEVFEQVHESNMSKVHTGVTAREDGKIMRGPDYRSPQLAELLVGGREQECDNAQEGIS